MVGSADLGINWPGPTMFCVLISPNAWYVAPYDGSRYLCSLEAVSLGWGPLNPCAEHVAASDSSGSASLRLMRCHGHMASCVPAHRHVAWCGSHRAHMMSCAYLSHPSSVVCKWYNHFNRIDEAVTMMQSKWAFGTFYDDAIFISSIHLLLIASFHVHFDVSCNKG
jgi:hypothetical protein